VDLDHGVLRVRRSRLRPKYAHGCDGTCGRKPGTCSQRVSTRPATGRVKSKAGRRTIGLPPQLVALLRAHWAEQERECEQARQQWQEEGWVFASPAGQPLNPNTDYHEWKRLLKEAGLREARLHDARHTAATGANRRLKSRHYTRTVHGAGYDLRLRQLIGKRLAARPESACLPAGRSSPPTTDNVR